MSKDLISTSMAELISSLKFEKPLSPDLFSVVAERAANLCADEVGKKKKLNSSTQIRRFYDEVVMWENKFQTYSSLEEKKQAFEQNSPYIQMIRSKIAYAKGRELLGDDMEALLNKTISNMKSYDTFQTGKLFFEAFLGFSKGLEK